MVNTAKNFLIIQKQLLQIHLKLSQKRAVQKTAVATGDLIGNKIAHAEWSKTLELNWRTKLYDVKITKISKTSLQNNSETVTNEYDKEIAKERYISPEERQEIIDDLRLI